MVVQTQDQQGSSAAVLIVDDQPMNVLALSAVLRPLEVRLVTAVSGKEALMHVEREPFAVALIDVQMPEMDGFELTKRLRRTTHGRELPVLFVTAIYREEYYLRLGYDTGAADYITKPYDPQVIRARVKAFVDLYEQREAVRIQQVALRTQERDEAIRRLIALERIATAALEMQDFHTLLEELLQAFIGAADATEFAAILLREGDWLRIEATAGFEKDPTVGFKIRLGEGFAGRVAQARRPMEVRDPTPDALVSPWLRAKEPRILYGTPLLHEGQVLGVAYVGSTQSQSFSDAEKRIFLAAAERAALAVARRQELSRLNDILTAAPGCIAIVRAEDYEYTFANPACGELFGSELVGQKLGERGFGPLALEVVRAARERSETVYLNELQIDADRTAEATDSPRYVRLTAHPLRHSAGAVERVLIFADDLTAQVEARRQIEAAQAARAQLLEQERAARQAAELASVAKDEFLATVSHELRTPLHAILGWVSLARLKGGTEAERALEIVERNARAQARIVEDVLEFSRMSKGMIRLSVARIDLGDVIRAALDSARPAAEARDITLGLDLQLPCRLMGDPERLQQVVWNLLSNAIKFTRSGGRIEVHASCAASMVTLRVTDTGQGIDPDFLPFVFESFRQADGSTTRRHGGLGLGLAIVRQIVQGHGGTISAHSEGLGHGAMFVVELPATGVSDLPERHSSPPATGPIPAGVMVLDGVKVLVVDDDEDGRELLAEAMSRRGAHAVACGSAEEALERVTSFRPHVLVSDIAMPGMDGYQLIRQLRGLSPASGGLTPAIAVTALTARGTRERIMAAGFQEYAEKPVDLDRLVQAVAALLELDGGEERATAHSP